MNRDERQALSINLWKKSNGKGTVQACTGYGKTVVGCKIIQLCKDKRKDLKIRIVVPLISLAEQWKAELKKRTTYYDECEVYVINSFIKLKEEDISAENVLYILDEIHNYGGNLEEADNNRFVSIWKRINPKFILGLSADVRRLDGLHQIILEKAPVIDTIVLEEAILNNWVSNVNQINLLYTLTKDEQEKVEDLSSSIKSILSIFNNDLNFAFDLVKDEMKLRTFITLLHSDLNMQLDNIDKEVKKYKGLLIALRLKIQQRNKLLVTAENKFKAILDIVTSNTKKTIIFSENIIFCELLKEYLFRYSNRSIYVYHSKIKPAKEKRLQLESFRNSKNGIMISAKALDEGYSDEYIEIGIASSFSRSYTQYIQRVGRVVRLRNDKLIKKCFFINLYANNTPEQAKLKSCQQNIKGLMHFNNTNTLTKYIIHESNN